MKEPGQIVLFQFPRTDLAEGKLRPALLISEAPDPYDDWLICMISSQLHQQIEGFDELSEKGDGDFVPSGLKKASVVRISRLAVVEGQILEGAIGQISSNRLQRIRSRLAGWIEEGKSY